MNTSQVQRPGRGRPRVQETADDMVASVLATAGPRASSSQYSTRRLAELTGLSQTLVSRAVRRIQHGGREAPGDARSQDDLHEAGLPEGAVLRLAAFTVEYPRITLTFHRLHGSHVQSSAQVSERAAQRRRVALMASLWVSGAAAWHFHPDDVAALSPAPQHSNPGHDQGDEVSVHWEPGGNWEHFLGQASSLLQACSAEGVPASLLQLLAARVGHGLHGVAWNHSGDSGHESQVISDSNPLAVPEFPAPGRSLSNRWLPRVQLSATEQIAVALRKALMYASMGPGDRLSATDMSELLGLGVPQVRTAMRQLADDGLLITDHGSFRIPQVAVSDVVDLYAARLHVGMVLLRGCAAQPRHALIPSQLALGTLEAVARRGTASDIGEADLRFQQELADASGLAQSARSFHALTLRIRMFIAVLQLDYSPAVERLVADDRRILAALLENNPEDAIRIWRAKLDNAVRHMSALAPESFDNALWGRLTLASPR